MAITRKTNTELYIEKLPTNTHNCQEIYALALSWLQFCQTQLPLMSESPQKVALDACRIVSLVICDRMEQNDLRFCSIMSFDSTLDIRGIGLVKPLGLPRPELGKSTPSKNSPERYLSREFLHLNLLSANPRDVFSGTSAGAGSSIINAIFQQCMEKNYEGVFVEPVASFEFFTKRGFVDSTLAGVKTGSEKPSMVWISSVFKAIPRSLLPAMQKDPKPIDLSGYLTLAYKLTKPERKKLLSILSHFFSDAIYLQVIEMFISTSKEAFRNRKIRPTDLEYARLSSKEHGICIPLFHQLICTSSVIRIMECNLAPNNTIPLHTYQRERIIVVLQRSQLQLQNAQETITKKEQESIVQFIPGSDTPYSCTNIGLQEYKALVFEFQTPTAKDAIANSKKG